MLLIMNMNVILCHNRYHLSTVSAARVASVSLCPCLLIPLWFMNTITLITGALTVKTDACTILLPFQMHNKSRDYIT